jgi:hypothetical protein
MEKRIIPVALLVLSLIGTLIFADNLTPAYALSITSFAITGTPNQMQKVGNTMFTLASSTGAYRVINLLTETETASATITITGTTFKGFRCNSTDCWILSVTGTTSISIQRITSATGVVEEGITITGDGAGNSDLGLSGSTIYFGRKCTTGDIGSSGAGDTDLAVFSLNGNAMVISTPIQHTDCGSNFSVISTGSEGLIGYKVNDDGSRLSVITNGAAGSDVFNWVSLTQSLTSSNNPHLCEVVITGASFSSANGRNIQLIGNKGYTNTNSGGDTFSINTISATCALSDTDTITAFNTAQATIVLDSENDIFYVGGIEADGTGNTVIGYNFANDVITTTVILQVFPSSSETSNLGMEFTSSINTVYLGSTTTIYVIDFGGAEEEEEGNQVDGFCGLGTLRDCLGSQSALSGLVPANQNMTSVGTTIGQGIGLIDPNNENPRTNGVGLFYMLITGSFFAIALMTTIHTLNMRGFISASVKEIDPIFWLFLVVGTVSVAWYLDWIDDIIFAAMTVGLAGLISFGVLKHFGRI